MLDLPVSPDIQSPLGKMDREFDVGMQGPEKADEFIFAAGFYLYRIVVHLVNGIAKWGNREYLIIVEFGISGI